MARCRHPPRMGGTGRGPKPPIVATMSWSSTPSASPRRSRWRSSAVPASCRWGGASARPRTRATSSRCRRRAPRRYRPVNDSRSGRRTAPRSSPRVATHRESRSAASATEPRSRPRSDPTGARRSSPAPSAGRRLVQATGSVHRSRTGSPPARSSRPRPPEAPRPKQPSPRRRSAQRERISIAGCANASVAARSWPNNSTAMSKR